MKVNLLSSRFPEPAKSLRELLEKVHQLSRPASESILDDMRLRARPKVTKRTTASWHQKGLIRHSWLQGQCCYRDFGVLAAIDQNAVNPIHSQLKIKL